MSNQKFYDVTIPTVIKDCEGISLGQDVFLMNGFKKMKEPDKLYRMRCLIMAVCLEGECGYTVDTISQSVRPNDIFVFRKGQVVTDCWQSPDFNGFVTLFSYSFFDEAVKGVVGLSSLFLFANEHAVHNISDVEKERLVAYYNMIKSTIENEMLMYRHETVQALVSALLYDISSVISGSYRRSSAGTRAERIFMTFMHLVGKNFCRERRVSWYSEQIGLSPKYLSETVKSVSNRTPNEWIDYYVMLELRVRLRNTEESIKQITEHMNFSSQSFLGKYFKEHAGMSPSEYRNNTK